MAGYKGWICQKNNLKSATEIAIFRTMSLKTQGTMFLELKEIGQ